LSNRIHILQNSVYLWSLNIVLNSFERIAFAAKVLFILYKYFVNDAVQVYIIIKSIKVCRERRRAQRKTFSGKSRSGGDTLQPTACAGCNNRASHNAKTIVWWLEKLGTERKYTRGIVLFLIFFYRLVSYISFIVYLCSCVHRPPRRIWYTCIGI